MQVVVLVVIMWMVSFSIVTSCSLGVAELWKVLSVISHLFVTARLSDATTWDASMTLIKVVHESRSGLASILMFSLMTEICRDFSEEWFGLAGFHLLVAQLATPRQRAGVEHCSQLYLVKNKNCAIYPKHWNVLMHHMRTGVAPETIGIYHIFF
jgi:hypothetical protein